MQTSQAIETARRRPFLHNSFILAVVFTLAVAAADGLLTRAGIATVGHLAFMAGVDVIVIWLLAEPWRPTLRTLWMCAGGCALGVCYFVVHYAQERIHFSASSPVDYLNYFASAAIIAPIYEEAIVRRWMFFGAAEWVGSGASALLVSALFALTHPAIPLFAFAFSLGMCFLAWRGIKTLDRAAFHGSHNLILQGLFVFFGT